MGRFFNRPNFWIYIIAVVAICDPAFSQIILRETGGGTNHVGLQAPAAITADILWTMPAADGSAGQCLSTNGSQVLSWITVPSSGSTITSGAGSSSTPAHTFSTDTDTGFYSDGSNNGFIGITSQGTDIGWINSSYTTWKTTFGVNYSNPWGAYAPSSTSSYSPAYAMMYVGNTTAANGEAAAIQFEVKNATVDQRGYIAAVSQSSGYAPALVLGHQTGANAYDERMRIDANGKVGIGTSSPTGKLHVNGTNATVVATGSGTAELGMSNTTASDVPPVLRLSKYGGSGNPAGAHSIGSIEFNTGNSSWALVPTAQILANAENTPTDSSMPTYLSFYTTPTSSTTKAERMRITGAGNVGIGTASPQSGLHILKNGANISMEGSDHVFMQFYPDGYAAGRKAWLGFGSPATDDFSISNQEATGNLVFSTNNGQRMTISPSGNVGVGTTSPETTLTVNGPISLKTPSTVNAATYTVVAADASLIFTTTNCSVTLPSAASFPGRIIYMKNITANSVVSASSNVVPLASATAGTAILAATAGKFAMLQSNGTNWVVMMAN